MEGGGGGGRGRGEVEGEGGGDNNMKWEVIGKRRWGRETSCYLI